MSSAVATMPASRFSFEAEKFAQGPVALWAVRESIGGKRLALALEHRVHGLDQALDRHLLGIIVAADKTVFRQSRPPDRGRGQAGRQQGREIEVG